MICLNMLVHNNLKTCMALIMPAGATRKTVADPPGICNLIFAVPDTDVRDFPDEVDDLARLAPEIITAIETERLVPITDQFRTIAQEAPWACQYGSDACPSWFQLLFVGLQIIASDTHESTPCRTESASCLTLYRLSSMLPDI